jgi:ribosomal protein S18 acetylase RimI-like enzyme
VRSHADQPTLLITKLANSEISQAVEVLSRAFRDNPLNRAVTRSENSEHRLRSNRHGMRVLLPVAIRYGQALVAIMNGVVAGGLVAAPPGRFPLPPPPVSARLRCLLGQGWQTARRWGEISEQLEALHPIEPHWYIGTLGVDPTFQGRGVGAGLLSNWLDEVDRDGAPAYLETDNERNIGFYERVGFRLDGEISIFGVSIWRMRRSPSVPAPK